MSKLPRISGRDSLRVLEKAGFYLKRRESSHMIVRRDTPFAQVVVHPELDRGTLRSRTRGELMTGTRNSGGLVSL